MDLSKSPWSSLKSIPLLGESASPFIDKGGGLTRERVRKLVSFVARVVGYKVIVDAHNTVDVRRMWEVLPCLHQVW